MYMQLKQIPTSLVSPFLLFPSLLYVSGVPDFVSPVYQPQSSESKRTYEVILKKFSHEAAIKMIQTVNIQFLPSDISPFPCLYYSHSLPQYIYIYVFFS